MRSSSCGSKAGGCLSSSSFSCGVRFLRNSYTSGKMCSMAACTKATLAAVEVIFPEDQIDAVVYGRRSFIVTMPFSRRNSTLSPLIAMSCRFRWQRTLNEHTTLLMTMSISGSGSGSCCSCSPGSGPAACCSVVVVVVVVSDPSAATIGQSASAKAAAAAVLVVVVAVSAVAAVVVGDPIASHSASVPSSKGVVALPAASRWRTGSGLKISSSALAGGSSQPLGASVPYADDPMLPRCARWW
uniref:Uncharacterized protein n=1 Tax=Anopheles merus TaxID=30066 RepID=A0A182UZE4_ANOME